ncbi:hypothetical protein [Ramlibacter sp.]|uniref:hypothetical protein n=1 Tax=Ramlibacter sp. TaxID=1917967 RepID=UPI003D0D4345
MNQLEGAVRSTALAGHLSANDSPASVPAAVAASGLSPGVMQAAWLRAVDASSARAIGAGEIGRADEHEFSARARGAADLVPGSIFASDDGRYRLVVEEGPQGSIQGCLQHRGEEQRICGVELPMLRALLSTGLHAGWTKFDCLSDFPGRTPTYTGALPSVNRHLRRLARLGVDVIQYAPLGYCLAPSTDRRFEASATPPIPAPQPIDYSTSDRRLRLLFEAGSDGRLWVTRFSQGPRRSMACGPWALVEQALLSPPGCPRTTTELQAHLNAHRASRIANSDLQRAINAAHDVISVGDVHVIPDGLDDFEGAALRALAVARAPRIARTGAGRGEAAQPIDRAHLALALPAPPVPGSERGVPPDLRARIARLRAGELIEIGVHGRLFPDLAYVRVAWEIPGRSVTLEVTSPRPDAMLEALTGEYPLGRSGGNGGNGGGANIYHLTCPPCEIIVHDSGAGQVDAQPWDPLLD